MPRVALGKIQLRPKLSFFHKKAPLQQLFQTRSQYYRQNQLNRWRNSIQER